MPRAELSVWAMTCVFISLWALTVVAGHSQRFLDDYPGRRGPLDPGFLGPTVPVVVRSLMRLQTAFARALIHLIPWAWDSAYDALNNLGYDGPTIVNGPAVGAMLDSSNSQWRSFVGALPFLGPGLLFAVFVNQIATRRAPGLRRALALIVGAAFLLVAHGSHAPFFLGVAWLNWLVAAVVLPRCPRAVRARSAILLWVLHIGLFYHVRLHRGYAWADAARALGANPAGALVEAARRWDRWDGMTRWDICYNITALRLLSYALDLTASLRARADAAAARSAPAGGLIGPAEPPAPGEAGSTLGGEGEGSLYAAARRAPPPPLPPPSLESYSIPVYLEYLLYPPLYVAGPIVSFDAFAAGRSSPPPPLPVRYLAIYALRVAGGVLLVDVLLHFCYLDLLTAQNRWSVDPASDWLPVHAAGCVGFAYLVFLWLKFLVLWRFFRWFALVDRVPAPENMRRCLCNNVSVVGFWRDWHSSFYQWIVRYLYVPVGGAQRAALATPLVFVFVALWHETDPAMLRALAVWAVLMFGAMLPEQMLSRAGLLRDRWDPARGYASLRPRRTLQAAVGAATLTILVAANAAGYCFGWSGLERLAEAAATASGRRLGAAAALFFFAVAQTALEVRAAELRLGGPPARLLPFDPPPQDKRGTWARMK